MAARTGFTRAAAVVLAVSAVAAGVAAGALAGSSGGSVHADGSATFTDPAGDVTPYTNPKMPSIAPVDITAVTVSDVTATGLVTFTAATTGFGTRGGNMISVYLDTDKNTSTGQPATGDDYRLGVSCCATDGSLVWRMDKWNGAALEPITPATPLVSGRNGDVFSWTVDKADLGGTAGFAFHVRSAGLDYYRKVIGPDLAPDIGTWTYDLSKPAPPPPTTAPAPVVEPVIGAPTTTPARPVAGRRLTVTFPVTRGDSGAPLTRATMICDPSVAGKVLAHRERFTAGTATLSLTVPKGARGKLLTVKLTIKTGSGSASRTATFRVR